MLYSTKRGDEENVFTNKFKVLVGATVGIIVAGGLTANQYQLEKRVDQIQTAPPVIVTQVITATPQASPTATLAPVRRTIVVTVAPSTRAVVPTR